VKGGALHRVKTAASERGAVMKSPYYRLSLGKPSQSDGRKSGRDVMKVIEIVVNLITK
jgi:hypothetical protein